VDQGGVLDGRQQHQSPEPPRWQSWHLPAGVKYSPHMAIPAMRMRCSLALLVTAVLLVAGGAGVMASPTSAAEPSETPEAPQAEFTGAVGYGFAVAMSADGRTAVVGQLGTAHGSVQEHDWTEVGGLVHVFTFDGSSWSEQATLRASDQSYDLLFGNSVAISADGNTVIVGDPGECAYEHICEHTAYVFTRLGTTWTQQAEFHGGSGFGGSVALSGDGNTALVGAGLSGWYGLSYGPEGNAPPTIFGRTGTTWTQEATLSTGATPYDYFGDAVALNGEGNVALIGRYDPGVDFFRMPAPSPRVPTGTKPPGTTSSNPPTSTSATSPSGGVTTAGGNGPGAAVAEVSSKADAAIAAEHVSVHVQRRLAARKNVHITFHAPRLPEGGYYYAVIVLKPYKKYTRTSPPPCAMSSDMQRTDYGYPQSNGQVALALTPAKSSTGHWCPSGSYEGAIYAVPHAPPCESAYPCHGEPHKELCPGIGPGCVRGRVEIRKAYEYPDGLPRPRATGTTIVARFSVRFP